MPSAREDSDEERRAALVRSLPEVGESDSPLLAQLALDSRRRIELRGRRFPKPAETRILTVANQKGGVGKTTTAVNLAAALAQAGLNVLVIDNDPQGNASTALGIDHRSGTPSIYEVLVEGAPLGEAVQQCPDIPRLLCVPATIDLSGAEIELVSLVARETRLRHALDAYLEERSTRGEERIDYVFVDCPPSLGLLTVNAFVVAREVLIPIQCEYYALEGLSQLLKTIQLIQAHLNPGLHVSTILLTMFDGRTNLAQQVVGEVREHFPELTLRTTVPRSVRISEAPSFGQTVMTHDASSSGALAYLEAAREIAERGAGTTGSGTAGSGMAGSGMAGSYTAGSGATGSHTAGSGPAGPDTTGPDGRGSGAAGRADGETASKEAAEGTELHDPHGAHDGQATAGAHESQPSPVAHSGGGYRVDGHEESHANVGHDFPRNSSTEENR
ncbi:AAA family ATPase [Cellulomonas fimi]|uniref:AAA family ATPase n=2 Tax=Cellulomonas fimi TaxID=1708 RepID=A0A7Y0LYH7_CELFI|nr:AAA family ATPase [Cellulomonas fimi]